MIITCKKQIPPRWIAFTILPWASFSLNYGVVGAAFVFSLKKFVENPAGLSFILSLPGFLAIIVAPLANFLSDRIWTRFGRRKPFVLTATIGMIVALVAMPLAPNFWTLVAAYVLYHISDGLASPRDPLKQEIVPPHERGRATGAMTWCQNIATVAFYSVMLGRFDDVRFFAGVPLHGEKVIYWSAALLLTTMLLLIALGIKEVDQKSPLQGQPLSIRNFVGGLFDRELWPIYILVFSFGLLNFFSGFGTLLSTLLYIDQWNYTKQEMGVNVAIGGIVNIFIIGLLTMFADRLPRLKAFQTIVILSLAWNAFYYCYVKFILPDQRPSLVEIIIFGEVLSILCILLGLIYLPLTYDYVRRNKMGTFAAGAQIVMRGTNLFTLNCGGLFVWAYASLFLPPAGEMARVVFREERDQAAVVAPFRAGEGAGVAAASGESTNPDTLTATAWQANGVVAKRGRAWEVRRENEESSRLAEEKQLKEAELAKLNAETVRLHEATGSDASRENEREQLVRRIEFIDRELAHRADRFRERVLAVFDGQLMREGEQLSAAQVLAVLVVDFPALERPSPKELERLLRRFGRDIPGTIDVRPTRRNDRYGIAVSVVTESTEGDGAMADRLREALARSAAAEAPKLLATDFMAESRRRQVALAMELQTVEQPVPDYISPVNRVVNALLGLVDRAHEPTRGLNAMARALRSANETNHVRVTLGAADRSLHVVALFEPSASQDDRMNDAVGSRLRALIGTEAPPELLQMGRAFYDRIERRAAAQRLTIARPVLTAGYAPMRYDYMSGYLWVFLVGVFGVAMTFVFARLERRGLIQKRGVEEAELS
jgi:Na+/melibiose symporter-like transporter